MRIVLLAAALATGLGFAAPASACRTRVPKPTELAGYKLVMLASVQSAVRLDSPGWNSWRVTARGERTLAGSLRPTRYTFNATLSSSGCGLTPLPPAGERWVVYLHPKHPDRVIDAFPLDLVRSIDPRLANVR